MESYDVKKKNFIDGKIAIPVKLTESGMLMIENQANIAYVLFHARKKHENKHLFKVESLVRIMPKEMALQEGYYLVQSTAKRYICVEIDKNKELDSRYLDPSLENVPYDAKTERYDSQYSTLDNLSLRNGWHSYTTATPREHGYPYLMPKGIIFEAWERWVAKCDSHDVMTLQRDIMRIRVAMTLKLKKSE